MLSQNSVPNASQFIDLVPNLNEALKPERVEVRIGAEHNRVRCAKHEDFIDAEWRKRVSTSSNIFNGVKFSMRSAKYSEGKLTLTLGISDYKTFIATNMLSKKHCESQGLLEEHMSQVLGVESLLRTSDNKVALFRRSKLVAEMPGFYCCPGGHPEPQKVLTQFTYPGHFTTPPNFAGPEEHHDNMANFLREHTNEVVRELYESALEEVAAEIGVPGSTLTNEGLCGVMANPFNNFKPDLLFSVKTSMSSDDVEKIFMSGNAPEKYESDDFLLFWDYEKLRLGEFPPLPVTPSSVACFALCPHRLGPD